MKDEAFLTRRDASIRARVQWLVRSIIEPKRVSGWRAILAIVCVVLCALLGSILLRLALVPSSSSKQLFAFAALFFSGGIGALAHVMPRPFSVIALRAGLVGLVVSVVWAKFASGA